MESFLKENSRKKYWRNSKEVAETIKKIKRINKKIMPNELLKQLPKPWLRYLKKMIDKETPKLIYEGFSDEISKMIVKQSILKKLLE